MCALSYYRLWAQQVKEEEEGNTVLLSYYQREHK